MKKTTPFYNTIGLKDKKYLKAISDAKTQQDRIYTILLFKNKAMTPFEMLDEYQKFFNPCPITSIRRALTNLTSDGLLEKSGMGMGMYGMPNWKWKTKSKVQISLKLK